jgi:hypothetical protein
VPSRVILVAAMFCRQGPNDPRRDDFSFATESVAFALVHKSFQPSTPGSALVASTSASMLTDCSRTALGFVGLDGTSH